MTRSLLMLLLVTLVGSSTALAQVHETVVYSFGSSPNDGMTPNGVLAFDATGNVYGTTQRGGANGAGTVFELSLVAGSWIETILYDFCTQDGCADGGVPEAGLILDGAGNLYGTTSLGGTFSGGLCRGAGCGTVFELSPPAVPGGSWVHSVLWNFEGDLGGDGLEPTGRLHRDAAGNLYGTTEAGNTSTSFGTVFELSLQSNGTWSEDVLYVFCADGLPCADGAGPVAGVSMDKSGNLYGTTLEGAYDGLWGTVYELTPLNDGNWSENTVFTFTPKTGGQPVSAVGLDPAGNLYGTTSAGPRGSASQCGGVWRLTPKQQGGYKEADSLFTSSGANGCTPMAGVFVDAKANTVVGTTSAGGAFNAGTVFKITGSKQKVIYNFCQQAGCADGSAPSGSFTTHGHALYSTTAKGGAFNQGVVFAITP